MWLRAAGMDGQVLSNRLSALCNLNMALTPYPALAFLNPCMLPVRQWRRMCLAPIWLGLPVGPAWALTTTTAAARPVYRGAGAR